MTAPHDPSDSTGLQFWRATLRWQRTTTVALKPLDLTHVQFVLLASVWWLTRVARQQPSQRRVAEHAGTDPMMTSQVLRALTSRGLVTRTPDPSDSRALTIGVTSAGADLAVSAVGIVEAADAAFFAAVDDQDALRSILSGLANQRGVMP